MPAKVYRPAGETLRKFHASDAFFRGIRGPIGSGKTVACCYELWSMALQQKPHPVTGWRKTRFIIIRDTYRKLETTTIKTWLEHFPESVFGKFKRSPPFRHLIRDEAQKFEVDVYFVGLDDEENADELLSSEWTGAFINEARSLPKGLVDDIASRIPRYPPRDAEVGFDGATRPGVVADTNSPGADHWWPILAGEAPPPEHWTEAQRVLYVKPPRWEFFTQPPAICEDRREGSVINYRVNENAENLGNLHPAYYPNMWYGKEREWIDVYLLNRYRTLKAGKPVYPDFDQERHVFKHPLGQMGGPKISEGADLYLGCDFGLTPAAVLIERAYAGFFNVLQEWVALDMTIPQFGQWLASELGKLGLGPNDYSGWGDPSGDARDQQGDTAFQLMRAQGIQLAPAPTNDPSIRIAVVTNLLNKTINKRPAIKFAPNCHYLINGAVHGYRYRRMKVSGEVYEEKPDKKGAGAKYTHAHDGLHYGLLGAGEGRVLIQTRTANSKVVTLDRANRNYNVWGKHGGSSRVRRRWV